MRSIGAILVLISILASCARPWALPAEVETAPPAYRQGYGDGREYGSRECGFVWAGWAKDRPRHETDEQYRAGWEAGRAQARTDGLSTMRGCP